MTTTTKLLRLLRDGPGTSGELAAELGIGQRSCAANLHRLWLEGRIDRADSQLRPSTRGAPAFVYGLPGVIERPSERPAPRPKRKRIHEKRVRPYKYRDRREYSKLRRQRLRASAVAALQTKPFVEVSEELRVRVAKPQAKRHRGAGERNEDKPAC